MSFIRTRRFITTAVLGFTLIAILFLGVGVANALTLNCFTDVTTGMWFHDYVCWMFDKGLTAGYPDGTYRPANPVSRAEIAVFLQQISGEGSLGPIVDADKVDGKDFTTQTGYLSVPAAAFDATQFDTQHYNVGYEANIVGGFSPYLVAPIFLPQDAIVTNVTFYWKDVYYHVTDPDDGILILRRVTMADNSIRLDMATVSSSGSTGAGSSPTSSITSGTIDNTTYSYYLRADLPHSDISIVAAVIEYTYQGLN